MMTKRELYRRLLKYILYIIINIKKEIIFKKVFKKLLLPEPVVPENYAVRAIE